VEEGIKLTFARLVAAAGSLEIDRSTSTTGHSGTPNMRFVQSQLLAEWLEQQQERGPDDD
jgi:hypothetical protein